MRSETDTLTVAACGRVSASLYVDIPAGGAEGVEAGVGPELTLGARLGAVSPELPVAVDGSLDAVVAGRLEVVDSSLVGGVANNASASIVARSWLDLAGWATVTTERTMQCSS